MDDQTALFRVCALHPGRNGVIAYATVIVADAVHLTGMRLVRRPLGVYGVEFPQASEKDMRGGSRGDVFFPRSGRLHAELEAVVIAEARRQGVIAAEPGADAPAGTGVTLQDAGTQAVNRGLQRQLREHIRGGNPRGA